MPLTQTVQKKLREVQYFLRQIDGVAQRVVGDPEEFEFLLSAFLSASVSITDPLDSRRYRTWFEGWRQNRSTREQDLLEFVRIQRNLEVHREGAETELSVHYVPLTGLRTNRQGHPAYGFHWSAPPGTAPPCVGVNVHEFELGGTKVQAYDTCREVTGILGKLVEAFGTAHPND
jgi:hypothetical protein